MPHSRLSWRRLLASLLSTVPVASAAPIITEFMADNKSVIADEDGAYSDWIEIHNPDATAVSLAGWRLTDNASNLAKWALPAVTLQPGEFLLVWASSKNRAVVGQPLHTNFSLSAGGEYLALVSPAGVVSTEFAPSYPAQEEDVSMGSSFASTTRVSATATARYLVPSSGSLGTSWTARTFSDTAWPSGTSGIGFGLLVPGMTVNEVGSSVTMSNLAVLDATLAGSNRIANDTQIRQVINFLGEGADGHFGANAVFAVPGENHGLKATGFISIPTTGAWTFGVNSDDGSRLRVDINNDGDFADAGETVILDDTGHAPQDFFGTVTLSAGSHAFEFVFYEIGGGDEVELFAAAGSKSTFDSSFRLIGDTANGGLAVATLPAGGTTGSFIGTNVQAAMQNVRSSCYMRQSFSLTAGDLASIGILGLQLRTNDGFVAYLNGTEVARLNAPAVPDWQSAATASRDATASLQFLPFNATAAKSALVAGTNVLAVHGMNVTAANDSFLMQPELVSGSLQAGGPFFFKQPTPGTLNSTPASLGFVADTVFSHKRGIYSAPFTLTITSATPGATIRYTTDGSKPTATTGTAVLPANANTPPVATISVNGTRVIRAAAFKTNWDPTNVDTNTYLFLDDVITQSPTGTPPAGWPGGTVNGQVLDYGMDPDVVNGIVVPPPNGGAAAVKAALQAIPSVCLNLPVSSLMDGATGIYTHAGNDGFAWEREASIEMLNDTLNSAGGFQENCGLRIRGGFSRSGDNPKHAFRIIFRGDYGAGKLDYPVFGADDKAAVEFDKFDIQTAQNYSWSFGGDGSNTFLRELWCRDTQLAMGSPSSRGRFIHLYLNGQYWGLYQIQERVEANFAASYFGGADTDYDVVKVEAGPYQVYPTDGDLNAWQDLWNKSRACYFINSNRSPTSPYGTTSYTSTQKNEAYFKMMGRAADGVTPTADPVLLDVDNLIDYMMIIFFSGNTDAPLSAFLGDAAPNNYYVVRDRRGGRGFLSFQHDGEHSLNAGSAAFSRVGPYNDPVSGAWNDFTRSNPQFTHQDLTPNLEYRTRFGDRVQKHLVDPRGALQLAANQARLDARAATVESAIVAESARWGDSKTASPLTAANWRSARDAVRSWFAGRNSALLSQLRSASLFPTLDAPLGSPQPGAVPLGQQIALSGSGGTVYYTVNGADPRVVGGGIAPSALTYNPGTSSTVTLVTEGSSGTLWRYHDFGGDPGANWAQPGFNDSAWRAAARGQFGYGDGDENTQVGKTTPTNLATYFRATFNVATLTGLTNLTCRVMRDDGVIVYLNGTPIVVDNMPASGVTYQTAATGVVGGTDESTYYVFSNLPLNLLQVGTNTIAAEIHQSGPDSSDISFDLRLEATQASGASLITLPGPGVATVRARVRDTGGNWSALSEQEWLVGTQPAAASNVVVSELMYHPSPVTPGEVTQGFTSEDDFQYVELRNVGTQHVDLRGAYFANGIDFTFPSTTTGGTQLAPGGHVLLVKDTAAFQSRHGTGLNALIAGEFGGTLARGGERLLLKQPDGTVILDFTYGDSAPWPSDADGGGFSLVLAQFGNTPADHNSPLSWRTSEQPNGNPGTSDATTYAAWKAANGVPSDTADTDGDGLTAFAEYAHGRSPATADSADTLTSAIVTYPDGAGTSDHLTVTFRQRLSADDVAFTVETSSSLATGSWNAATTELVGSSHNGDGTASVTYRVITPWNASADRTFIRVRTALR